MYEQIDFYFKGYIYRVKNTLKFRAGMKGQRVCITGCMFAGKTTKLVELYEKCDERKLAIKYIHDNRYSDEKIHSHDNISIESLSCFSLNEISNSIINNVDVFFIDEVQFFDDLIWFINKLINKNKGFVLAGLDYDCYRKEFGQTIQAEKLCNEVIRLSAKCRCGRIATITKKNKEETNKKKQIDIGGAEKYQPVCENCYNF